VRKAWQPYHHPVPLSCNLGTLTSWNPLGHSRPVPGLLYLYLFFIVECIVDSDMCSPTMQKMSMLHSHGNFLTAKYIGQHYKGDTVAFPWQQWLRERSTVLRYTYIPYIVPTWRDLQVRRLYLQELSSNHLPISIVLTVGLAVTWRLVSLPHSAEIRVRCQATPCVTCDGSSGTGRRFSPPTSVFPTHCHSTIALYKHFIHWAPTVCNRSIWQPG
jgi:hypothetical protein